MSEKNLQTLGIMGVQEQGGLLLYMEQYYSILKPEWYNLLIQMTPQGPNNLNISIELNTSRTKNYYL